MGRALLPLALAPLPFLLFVAWLGWRTGEPGAYFLAQDALGAGSLLHPRGPVTMASALGRLRGEGAFTPGYPPGVAFPVALIPAALDAGALLLGGLLGLWLLRRARPSYGLFVLTGVTASFLVLGLPGSSRRLLALSLLFLALSLVGRWPVGYVAALLGVTLQALTMYLYVNGFFAG